MKFVEFVVNFVADSYFGKQDISIQDWYLPRLLLSHKFNTQKHPDGGYVVTCLKTGFTQRILTNKPPYTLISDGFVYDHLSEDELISLLVIRRRCWELQFQKRPNDVRRFRQKGDA